MENSNKDISINNSKITESPNVAKFKRLNLDCADEICEPVYKKFKCNHSLIETQDGSHNSIYFFKEFDNALNCNDPFGIHAKEIHPNLHKYISTSIDSVQNLGINLETQDKTTRSMDKLDLLSSSTECAYNVLKTAHFLSNQPIFAHLPSIQVPYSNILKNFGLGNNQNPRERFNKENLKSMFLESDHETEKINSQFIINPNVELDIEWSDALLTYNPISDVWPYSLSPLEISMIPSFASYDSRNWDIIDNLSCAKPNSLLKKGNPLRCKVALDNRNSNMASQSSLINNQIRSASDIRLANKQCTGDLFNKLDETQQSDRNKARTTTQYRHVPFCLKSPLGKKNNKKQENCDDETLSYCMMKKNEIGNLNKTVEDVAEVRQIDQDAVISENTRSPKTSFQKLQMLNLQSNDIQSILPKSKEAEEPKAYTFTNDSCSITISKPSSDKGKLPSLRSVGNEIAPKTNFTNNERNQTMPMQNKEVLTCLNQPQKPINFLPNTTSNLFSQNKISNSCSFVPESHTSTAVIHSDGSSGLEKFPTTSDSFSYVSSTASFSSLCRGTEELKQSSLRTIYELPAKIDKFSLPCSNAVELSSLKFKNQVGIELPSNLCNNSNSIVSAKSSSSYSSIDKTSEGKCNNNPNFINVIKVFVPNNNVYRKIFPKPQNFDIEQGNKSRRHSYKLRSSQKLNSHSIDSTSKSIVSNCSKSILEQSDTEAHSYLHTSKNINSCTMNSTSKSITNICSKPISDQDQSLLHSCSTTSQNLNPCSIDSRNISVSNDCPNPSPAQDKSMLLSFLCASQNLNNDSIDSRIINVDNNCSPITEPDVSLLSMSQNLNLLSMASANLSSHNNCLRPIFEQGKTGVPSYSSTTQNLNSHSIDSMSESFDNVCSKPIPEHDKSVFFSKSKISQNINPLSIDSSNKHVANDCLKPIPKPNKLILNSCLTTSSNLHFMALINVKSPDKTLYRKILPKTQNYARLSTNDSRNLTNTEFSNCSKPIPQQGKIKLHSYIDTSQSLTSCTINSTSKNATNICEKPIPEQDQSIAQLCTSTSQGLNPPSLESANMSVVSNCSNNIPEHGKAKVHSFSDTFQNLNPHSIDSMSVSIDNNFSKPIPKQGKLVLHSCSSTSNLNHHSIDSPSVSNVSNCSKSAPEHGNTVSHSCLNSSQNLNSCIMNSMSESITNICSKPLPKQDQSLFQSDSTTSQNQRSHSSDSFNVNVANDCPKYFPEQDISFVSNSVSLNRDNVDLTTFNVFNNGSKSIPEHDKTRVHTDSDLNDTKSISPSVDIDCSRPILEYQKIKFNSCSTVSQNLTPHSMDSVNVSVLCDRSKSIREQHKSILQSILSTSQNLCTDPLDSMTISVDNNCLPIPEQDNAILNSSLSISQNMNPHSKDSTNVSVANNSCHISPVTISSEVNNVNSFLENDFFDTTLPVIENIFSLSNTENLAKDISSINSNKNPNCSLIGPLLNESNNMPFFIQVPTSSVKEVMTSLKLNPSNINLAASKVSSLLNCDASTSTFLTDNFNQSLSTSNNILYKSNSFLPVIENYYSLNAHSQDGL